MEERDDDIKPQSDRLSATYGAVRMFYPGSATWDDRCEPGLIWKSKD